MPSRSHLSAVLLSLLLPMAAAEDYFPPPDSAGGWRVPADAAATRTLGGMDTARLDQAGEQVQRCGPNVGLLVAHHGWLVYERYWGQAHRDANPDMASTGKAFTSVACGIMLDKFRDQFPDGLGQKVFTTKYLPEAFPLDDPRRADITLGQLLCMTAGYHGEGSSPGIIDGRVVPLPPAPSNQDLKDLDGSSLHIPLWTAPGGGYSYASASPHIASIVLRHVAGMDLKDCIDQWLAKPMGFGAWNYCLYRGAITLSHANGAGSIALRATDALRFAFLLLHRGQWAGKQLVPAAYVAQCGRPSPINPHAPFSLMFENNSDGHVAGAPRDAYWKSGAGGFCIYVVPSLDLVVYKMGGDAGQYQAALTGLPQLPLPQARAGWKPIPRTPFHDGSLTGDDGLRRVLEMVAAAVVD